MPRSIARTRPGEDSEKTAPDQGTAFPDNYGPDSNNALSLPRYKPGQSACRGHLRRGAVILTNLSQDPNETPAVPLTTIYVNPEDPDLPAHGPRDVRDERTFLQRKAERDAAKAAASGESACPDLPGPPPPPADRPRTGGCRDPNDPYVLRAMELELAELTGAGPGTRNSTLNTVALKLARLSVPRDPLRAELIKACIANNLVRDDGMGSVLKTIRSAFGKADREGQRVVPDMEPLGTVSEVEYDSLAPKPRRDRSTGGQDADGDAAPGTWQPVNLTDGVYFDGTWQPPQPTVGLRSDGVGLFYPRKMHTVASESEGGKTWYALVAVVDEILRRNHVLYIDFEDDCGPIVGRLMALGVSPDYIREFFHYVRPESSLLHGRNRDDLANILTEYGPTLAVIDGVTEAMTLHELNPLDNADAAKFGRLLPRPIAESGAAVVSMDHVTKSADSRGRYAIGAVHKLNVLDGAAYILENRRPFGHGLSGVSTVRIAKDRPGELRRHAAPGGKDMLPWFADLVVDSTTEGHTEAMVVVPADQGATHKPTKMMERVASELAGHPSGLSQRVICDVVTGKAVTIRTALSYLIADGYVSAATPHRLLKPYPDETDKS